MVENVLDDLRIKVYDERQRYYVTDHEQNSGESFRLVRRRQIVERTTRQKPLCENTYYGSAAYRVIGTATSVRDRISESISGVRYLKCRTYENVEFRNRANFEKRDSPIEDKLSVPPQPPPKLCNPFC